MIHLVIIIHPRGDRNGLIDQWDHSRHHHCPDRIRWRHDQSGGQRRHHDADLHGGFPLRQFVYRYCRQQHVHCEHLGILMGEYDLNKRPMPGGSMSPRLNPKIVETQLNTKLGPRVPMIRETSNSALNLTNNSLRRRNIGLASRFDNKG